MTIVVGIFAFFVILAVLILVHESGHFTFAKLTGVRVDEFGLGFPPRLKSWRRGGTVYSLNAIPLGGFVKMLGENGEDDQPDSFGSKAPWQRLLILVSGPSMNLLLALAIFFVAFMAGSPRSLTVITAVSRGSPAAMAGLRSGDRIIAVNSSRVRYGDQVQTITSSRAGRRVTLRVRRGSIIRTVSLFPRVHPPIVHGVQQGAMGITLGDSVTIRHGPVASLGMSFGAVGGMIASVPALLAAIGQHQGSTVSGPIGIARVTTSVVHEEPSLGPGSLLEFVALLSANLGVLNLLPIPALDGGRIVFVLLSWVRRRNLDPEIEGVIHLVGMASLLLLILFISYHDIVSWVTGASF